MLPDGMTRAVARRGLIALIVAGGAVNVALAFATIGHGIDVHSYALVAGQVRGAHPFHLYSALNNHLVGPRWPYPPGFIPWIVFSDKLAARSSLPFHGTIQLPGILATAATAWVVAGELARRKASPAKQLVAGGLIAIGPLWILVAGWWAQLDPLALFPAVLAAVVWDREPNHRAVYAGLLAGSAAALKTPLGLVVLALLPTARTPREAATVLVVAVSIPLLMLAPFLAADAHGTVHALRYSGTPGIGGLSLVVQPRLAEIWITTRALGSVDPLLVPIAGVINGCVLAGVLLVGFRWRPPAATMGLFLWVAVCGLGTGFTFTFLLWPVAFALLDGRVGLAAVIQALTVIPALLLVTGPHSLFVAHLYAAWMISLWLATLALIAWLLREFRAGRGAPAVAF